VLWFRDFQSVRVSTDFRALVIVLPCYGALEIVGVIIIIIIIITAPHKIIDRLYQNRVFLDRLYLDRVYFDRVYRLPPNFSPALSRVYKKLFDVAYSKHEIVSAIMSRLQHVWRCVNSF